MAEVWVVAWQRREGGGWSWRGRDEEVERSWQRGHEKKLMLAVRQLKDIKSGKVKRATSAAAAAADRPMSCEILTTSLPPVPGSARLSQRWLSASTYSTEGDHRSSRRREHPCRMRET
ncbi:PREDICTED: uncharacterized protein LOC106820329 [Priapulus caudatus]|uniref:Uncharacterized protein LOC106820329 n=1 Tax=Priapulus caudatus TaxID=37621 RepID=A0ABM1F7B9_PRICU|nr:PREDICTED: uncharacterized protein LOC106820329 [Priapulus caudatus]